MRTAFPLVLSLVLWPLISGSQSFAGEYFLAAGEGEVVFQVRETGWNQLGGILIDSDGTRYQASATVEKGDARGTLANNEGGMYFEAYFRGEQLVLRIMPADVYNQPDYLNASEFVLTRREIVRAPIELAQEAPRQDTAAQPAPVSEQGLPQGSWEGAFFGVINETEAGLAFSRYGNQLSGEIDAGGYKYVLEGAISGNEAWGEVLDPQTQGKMKFSGNLSANVLSLTFSAENGQSEIVFLTESTRPLPGHWMYSQTTSQGRSTRTRQLLMVLQPGGRFYYGDAQAVRTAPEGEGVARGRWRIADNALYIEQEGKWNPFAAYQVRGESLFLKFSSGGVQEWKRVK